MLGMSILEFHSLDLPSPYFRQHELFDIRMVRALHVDARGVAFVDPKKSGKELEHHGFPTL